jgi:hypothetical protein
MISASDEAPADRVVLYKLAYDEARRRLDAQEASVDELRSRSGVLLAAATIVTSFLGGRFVNSTSAPTTGVEVALGSFVLCVVLALLTLLPLGEWKFYFGTSKLIREYIEDRAPMSLGSTYRDLALHLESNHTKNEDRLHVLYWIFSVSAFALFVEVIAWLAHLGWGI